MEVIVDAEEVRRYATAAIGFRREMVQVSHFLRKVSIVQNHREL